MLSVLSIGALPGTTTLLNEEFASIDCNVPGLRVPLLPHQRVLCKAMCDVEDTQHLACFAPNYEHLTLSPVELHTCAMSLGDPYESGLQTAVIAFCLLRPIPRALRANFDHIDSAQTVAWRPLGSVTSRATYLELPVHETTRFICATLIIVTPQEIDDWYVACRALCFLQSLKVSKVHHAHLLCTARTADVTLCCLPVSTITKWTQNALWARVVYGPHTTNVDDRAIRASFSVYLGPRPVETTRHTPYPDSLRLAAYDPLLFTNFALRCSHSFLVQSVSLPKIKGWMYRNNTHRTKMINSYSSHDAQAIAQWLDNDVYAAANSLNIVCGTVEEIASYFPDHNTWNRMQRAIHDAECQVCLSPLAENGVWLMKCCGAVTCAVCGVKANRILPTRHLQGFCCNCKKPLHITDLIYVHDHNIVQALQHATFDEVSLPSTAGECTVGILQGVVRGTPCTIHCGLATDRLVEPQQITHTIIFAQTDCVRLALITAGIPFVECSPRLRKKSAQVMLVRLSTRDVFAPTLDLSHITQVIFVSTCKQTQENILRCCQRVPRQTSLIVHCVCYEDHT